MSRQYVVFLTFAVVALALAAAVAMAEPISAGTAPGKVAPASKSYVTGKHYPLGGSIAGMFSIGGPWTQPFNGTRPYSEWPDRALVSGRKPAMSREYVILGSRRRE
ncbi:MAG: hypothetical protein HPY69_09665 [Armatimonadetes bacterium]|nr:hypothetical protein [Armatimonadota bacterium]